MKYIIAILALCVGSVFVYRFVELQNTSSLPPLQNEEEQIGSYRVKKINKKEFLPGVVFPSFESLTAYLTVEGIIKKTNEMRNREGLPPLTYNVALSTAAERKVADMFTHEYFEHVSPQGIGIGTLIEAAGYDYLFVGENLAKGNFADDTAVVDAWMNSPGHRANILNPTYAEIGVSAIRGTFEGKQTWLAVQEFGLPSSACPIVDESQKSHLDNLIAQYEQDAKTLQQDEQELSSLENDHEAYNNRVTQHNVMVERINDLAREIESGIESFNASVTEANTCIESYRSKQK